MSTDTQKRNEEIFNRKENGETFAALAREYGISATRITQIYESERRKRAVVNAPVIEPPCCKEETELYKLVMNFACENGFEEMLAQRFYGFIVQSWRHIYSKGLGTYPPVEFIQEIRIDQDGSCRAGKSKRRVRGMGEKTRPLLFALQEYLEECVKDGE